MVAPGLPVASFVAAVVHQSSQMLVLVGWLGSAWLAELEDSVEHFVVAAAAEAGRNHQSFVVGLVVEQFAVAQSFQKPDLVEFQELEVVDLAAYFVAAPVQSFVVGWIAWPCLAVKLVRNHQMIADLAGLLVVA